MHRHYALLTILVMGMFGLGPQPARAIVGAAEAPDLAPFLVMILQRSGSRSSFCSGSVLAPNIVLTAAHCVTAAAEMRVFFRQADGKPILLPVAAIESHPEYRADAITARRRSIDLALIRLAEPLPSTFRPLTPAADGAPLGTPVILAGYGVGREGQPMTSGRLRQATVRVRAPQSAILLWLADPAGGVGACTGDSGGPVLTGDGSGILAVIDWAAGGGKTKCGALTQATLIGPQQAWLTSIMQSWAR